MSAERHPCHLIPRRALNARGIPVGGFQPPACARPCAFRDNLTHPVSLSVLHETCHHGPAFARKGAYIGVHLRPEESPTSLDAARASLYSRS